MDYAMLGKRIRDERLLLRLTIDQLAEKINKSSNYVGQIERNDGKPSLETIVDIANALGTTVDRLLEDSILVSKEDKVIQEMNTLLYSIDDRGRKFLLDVVKRYAYYYNQDNGNQL